MGENMIETWAAEEYREDVSAGAAARQLCRSLGIAGSAPTLRRLLEDLLGEANDRAREIRELKRELLSAARASSAFDS